MPAYFEIAVNVPQAAGSFHYHAPPELEGALRPGHLVTVPFGKQTVQGVVLAQVEQPDVAETRPVLSLLDPQPALTLALIGLAQRMAQISLAPLAAWIDLLLPPGLGRRAESLYTLNANAEQAAERLGEGLSALQRRLVAALAERGPLRTGQLQRGYSRQNWQSAMQALIRRGLVSSAASLPEPGVRPKTVRTARLALPAAAAEARLAELGRAGTPALARRQAMLRLLLDKPAGVQAAWLYAETGGELADLRRLETLGLISLGEAETYRDPLEDIDLENLPLPPAPPALTTRQAECWQAIETALAAALDGQAVRPLLLHGVTGSGKTELYLRAVAAALAAGRQAIVLVPEIALTPQTVRRFMARFAGQVGLVHSRLSEGERYDTWRRARSGALSLVVGPRSALFTPFPRLGLVVVDEFHDDTYFSEEPPSYHARQAAMEYARLAGAVCLLGSATPDLATYYHAGQGRLQLLELPQRVLAHVQAAQAQAERLGRPTRYRPLEADAESLELPPVQVVDMRGELKAGNRSIFSRALQAGLGRALEQGEQAILFLNRRGSATYVFCRDCGAALKCPRCDLPLTYHEPPKADPAAAEPPLQCHRCGYTRRMPAQCPECDSPRIRSYGVGTEKVEAEVQALFPQARTLRWDAGTARTKGSHEVILSHFASRRADVLVGTQMLAKGLDLPLVTLVGVVLADVGLTLPDFRAGERMFQLLTQVAGRAGRSPLGGEVVLQTFQPEHYVIQAAAGHDYAGFYARELAYRRQTAYPPFSRLVRLEFRHLNADRAEEAARKLAARLQGWIAAEERRATELIGPAPCFFGRLGGYYRWQIVLRGPDPAGLLRGKPLGECRVEVDPVSLL